MGIWFRCLSALLFITTIAANTHDTQLYINHQLWRLYANDSGQIAKILAFSRISHLHDINFWSENFQIHEPVGFYSDQSSFIIADNFLLLNISMFVSHLKQLKCSLISCQQMI